MKQMKLTEQSNTEKLQAQSQKVQRWDVVLLITFLMFGSCYCMQEIPTINDYLKSQYIAQDIIDYDYDHYINIAQSCALGILILYTSYIGYVCDKFKPGIIIIIQSLLMVIGQFMILLSVRYNNFWLLFVGRIVLFVQCSSLFITSKVFVNNFTTEECKYFSLCIMYTCASAFGINLLAEPNMVKELGLDSAIFITFLIASICFLISLVCYQIEQQTLLQIPEIQFLEIQTNSESTIGDSKDKIQVDEEINTSEKGYFEEFKHLDLTYWIYCPLSSLSIVISTVVEVCGPAILSQEWKYEPYLSAQINSIGQFMGLAVPLLGYLIDNCKIQFELVIIACAIQLLGITLIGLFSPITGFIIYGLGLNLRISVLGPLLTKLVPKSSLGKSFGLVRSLKDFLGMLLFLYISITIQETESYQSILYLLIVICFLILCLSIILFIFGKKQIFA